MKKYKALFLYAFTVICYGQNSVKFVDSIRNAYHIPELNYAVVNNNSILEIAALGFHSVKLKDTATCNDRFHIGSNTKAMTSFIIAKYVERGKLRWNSKFFEIFPDWKTKSKKDYHQITLQDLLSHRAKIQAFQGNNDPIIPDFKGTKQQKRKQFGQFVLTLNPIVLDTITNFSYSNADYTLATLMLEKATNKSWEQLVAEVFNKELHLNVQFSWPENQKIKDTWGHLDSSNMLIPVPSNFDYHLDYTEPAGDINIKLIDYIKFIQLNLQGLNGTSNYLNAKTYQYMHKGIPNYSLGWYNIYENGIELSTHSGTAGTYYSLVHIDRSNGLAYIIFTNAYCENTKQGVRLIMRKLKENHKS